MIMLFMMSVSTILLNILIAQLSLTYEMVQEESLHSFTALRMQAVSTIEWQSRFKFWVSKMADGIKFMIFIHYLSELFVSSSCKNEVTIIRPTVRVYFDTRES